MRADLLPFPKTTAKQERRMGKGQDGRKKKKTRLGTRRVNKNNKVTKEQPQRKNAKKEIHEGKFNLYFHGLSHNRRSTFRSEFVNHMKNPMQVYEEENKILPDNTCDVKQGKDWLSIFPRAFQ